MHAKKISDKELQVQRFFQRMANIIKCYWSSLLVKKIMKYMQLLTPNCSAIKQVSRSLTIDLNFVLQFQNPYFYILTAHSIFRAQYKKYNIIL